MRVFLSAGEASGDTYAAALVRALREEAAGVAVQGVGGKRLTAEIGSLVADSSRWGAISIAQSLVVTPRVLSGYFRARRVLQTGRPGVFVPIDFGFANIRLARFAKEQGWKVLYFVPPGSWRRDRQGRDLPAITDAIVTPFPWSRDLLKEAGANVHFFGHPILSLIGSRPPVERGETVAILPGSREHEIERNLPLIAKVMASVPNPSEFALSPSTPVDAVQARWQTLTGRTGDRFTVGDVYGVLERAAAGVVCSGTATLEAALMGCPMVVVYQVTKAMAVETKLIGFKKPEFIALPNIALQRQVVPEWAHVEIDPMEVRAGLLPLLADSPEREAQLAAFAEIRTLLSGGDAVREAAKLILALAQ